MQTTRLAVKGKPTAIRELEGFPSHTQVKNKNEPTPPKLDRLDVSLPPADLPKNAKKIWMKYAQMLVDVGVLTVADIPTFKRYCKVSAINEQALAEVAEDGYVWCDDNGKQYQTAAMKTVISTNPQLITLEAQLGMTPVARSKVIAISAKNPIEDDFDD